MVSPDRGHAALYGDTAMSCEGCGACCIGTRVELRFGDMIPPELTETIDQKRYLRREDGHCILLDMETRRCKDYDHRPIACRNFERGSGTCGIFRLRVGIEVLDAEAA